MLCYSKYPVTLYFLEKKTTPSLKGIIPDIKVNPIVLYFMANNEYINEKIINKSKNNILIVIDGLLLFA